MLTYKSLQVVRSYVKPIPIAICLSTTIGSQYYNILEQMDLIVSLPLHLYSYSIQDYVCFIIQLQSTFLATTAKASDSILLVLST